MRVHEFAKEYNLTSKQALELLKKEGSGLKSHISVIPDDVLVLLRKRLSLVNNGEVEKAARIETKANSVVAPENNLPLREEKSVKKTVSSYPKKTSSSSTSSSSKSRSGGGSRSYKSFSPRKKTDQKVVVKKEEKKEIPFELQPLTLQPITIADFCIHTNKPVSEVIITLLKEGQVCTKNHMLSVDQVEKLAKLYEVELVKPVFKKTSSDAFHEIGTAESNKGGVFRLPVVVVMGHVDHGKTSLLDYIRKTRVTAREKGGITQHLGAYEAHTPQGNIVFLDTPGHEAFSKIRQRGASAADIAILVVAADDGVMPQTVESIKAIQAMKLPVVVAINKIDKADIARVDIIKRQLSQYGILPEEWGGQVVCCPISAKTGQGIDTLLEMVLLQAEMLELKTIKTVPAQGYILESKIERGRGAVATVLCRQGVLRVGDFFSAGKVWGKVASLVDSYGAPQKEIGASTPAIISGFEDFPSIGELLRVVSEEEYRKERGTKIRLNNLRATISADKESLPIIIKADTNSSLEAVLDGIDKISKTADMPFYIVHAAVGNVTENDVILAETSNSLVIGFHTKIETAATQFARTTTIKILPFDIIYKLFEDLELRSKKAKVIEKKETKIGEATVLKVFDIKKLGVIAGCYIREGRFSENGNVIIKRGRKQVGEGKVKSLQRDKKSVKEVHTGYECAFIVDNFTDWQVDDTVECYLKV
jgi:translation initiation factor IF-2